MEYKIEKNEGGKWVELEFLKDVSFEEIDYLFKTGETINATADLSLLKGYKELTPGKYKIVNDLGEIEFTLN